MPKTPGRVEVFEDVRYFTIVHAYPAHPNMELVGDLKACAYWLASILGSPDHLRAIYHKRATAGMIIVAVAKAFNDVRRLLGAHKWSEFLHNPGPGNAGRVSRIYFCELNTDDKCSKEGWKYNDINSSWFTPDHWRLDNLVVKYPYPMSKFCALPTEVQDPTNRPLCRPLPERWFPEARQPVPILAIAPVVGSPAYIQEKSKREQQTTTSKSSRRRKGRNGEAEGPSTHPTTPDSATATEAQPARAAESDWTHHHPDSKLSPGSFLDLALGAPPGIPNPSWAAMVDEEYENGPSALPSLPDLVPSTSSGSSNEEAGVYNTRSMEDALSNLDEGDDDDGPYLPAAYLSAPSIGPDDSASVAGARSGNVRSEATVTGGSVIEATDDGWGGAPVYDDGWGGAPVYADSVVERQSKRPGQPDCPEHGIECGKGICRYQVALKNKARREKEATERAQQRKEEQERRERMRSKRSANERGRPPHLDRERNSISDDEFLDSISNREGSTSRPPSVHGDDDTKAGSDVESAAPSHAASGWSNVSVPVLANNRKPPSEAGTIKYSSGASSARPSAPPSISDGSHAYAPSFAQRKATAPSAAASVSGWTNTSSPFATASKVTPPAAPPSVSGWTNTSTPFSTGPKASGAPASTWGPAPGAAGSGKGPANGKLGTKAWATTAAPAPAASTFGRAGTGAWNGVPTAAVAETPKNPWDSESVSVGTASTNNGWGPPKAGRGNARGRGTPRGNGFRGGGGGGRGNHVR